MEKLIIIGSWPAGHTAAIYAARAWLEPVMLEWFMAWWVAAWGQLTTTTSVENFPGFPDWIMGYELMDNMRKQSINSWTKIFTLTAESVKKIDGWFEIKTSSQIFEAKTIIIATWATAKRLWIEWEEVFWNKWISACAVCDWGLPIFRNKPLAVVWGWDVACEEATHLSHFGEKVYMIVRKDFLRASKAMQQKVFSNSKIEILRNSEVKKASWEKFLENIHIFDNKNNQNYQLIVNWLFYAIGHTPNTSFLDWLVETDEAGYIITNPWTTQTSEKWIFAAWDVQDKIFRQAITSAWTGCMAALQAQWYLEENK